MINDLDEVQYEYLLSPTFQFVNSAGKPITGGWMEVYIHGTRTKYYCCSDWDGTLHPFKIPLDSLGSNIVLASPAFAYDVYVYNRFGSLIMSRYNVIPTTGGSSSGVIPVDITIESQDETVDVTVSGTTYNLSISGTIDKLDTVSADVEELKDIIASGFFQSDWDESDTSSPAYIKNKPEESTLIAGDNICIFASGSDYVISASGVDTSEFATHTEVNNVSGSIITVVNNVSSTLDNKIDAVSSSIPDVSSFATHTEVNTVSSILESEIQAISGSIPEPFEGYTSPSGTSYVDNTNFTIEQSNSAIDITSINDWQPTGQTSISTTGWDAGFTPRSNEIKFVSNDNITGILRIYKEYGGTEYVEGTYDSSDTVTLNLPDDYLNREVWIYYDGQVPTDLTIYQRVGDPITTKVVRELAWKDDVMAVSAAIPDVSEFVTETELTSAIDVITGTIPQSQVQSDWTEDDTTDPAYIKNKPDEVNLVAGDNISIVASGTDLIISSTVTGGGTTYNAGSGINIDVNTDTISVDTTIIPTISAVSAMIDAASANGNLFIAKYKVTTWQEISDAYESGKCVVCDNGPAGYMLMTRYINSSLGKLAGFGTFSVTIATPANYIIYHCGPNGWTQWSYQLQSDWNETAQYSSTFIKNKPDLSVYTTQSQVSAIASAYASGGGGSGVNYQAGDHIDITNDTISVTGITELVAGTNVTITMNGDSAVISSAGGQQVQADWDESDSSSPAYIQNKPSIPQDPEQSDWNETDPYSLAYIKNKPNISEAYTGASGIAIDNSVISLDEPLGIVAGSGINIVIEGDSAIICVSGVTGGGGTSYNEGYGIDITNDTISVDTTVIPTVSAVQAMISAASGSNNLFIATYNSTPRQDLIDAYNAGKYIVCKSDDSTINNDYSFAPLYKYQESNQGFYFVRVPWQSTSSGKLRGSYGINICWNASDVSYANKWNSYSYSLISDWNETDTQSINYIQNKPDLSVYTTSTQVSAIVEAATGNIPTTVQVNSDWNATSGVAEILNKPVEANLLPGSGITIAASGSDYIINTTPIELVTALPANPVSGVLYLIPEA